MPDTSWPTCSMLDAAEVVACWSPTIACCRWVVLFGWMIVSLFSLSLFLSFYINLQRHKAVTKSMTDLLRDSSLHCWLSTFTIWQASVSIPMEWIQSMSTDDKGLQIHRFRNFRRTMVALQPLWRFLFTPDNAISRCPMLQFTHLTVFLATYQWMWHLLRIEGSQRCSGRWSPFQDLSFFGIEAELFTGDVEAQFWNCIEVPTFAFRKRDFDGSLKKQPCKLLHKMESWAPKFTWSRLAHVSCHLRCSIAASWRWTTRQHWLPCMMELCWQRP